jgi:hypothetical protein
MRCNEKQGFVTKYGFLGNRLANPGPHAEKIRNLTNIGSRRVVAIFQLKAGRDVRLRSALRSGAALGCGGGPFSFQQAHVGGVSL